MRHHDLKVEYVPIADLVPADYNPREWSDKEAKDLDASLRKFGVVDPLLVNSNPKRRNVIIGGHFRLDRLLKAGEKMAPVIFLDLTKKEEEELNVRLNKNTGHWSADKLLTLFPREDLVQIGFNAEDYAHLLAQVERAANDPGPNVEEVEDVREEAITREGDVWILGGHRVMCGDSRDPERVAQLMAGATNVPLLHADPPYGMGKEGDGVANDNLYKAKLDEFQMAWWRTFRPYLAPNASAYVWGNAPDLWRLWYVGGLEASEKSELRNEIVWDKKSIAGMASDAMTLYPAASERCLFFQLGEQYIGNVNADRYFEGWDELRVYLAQEAEAAKLTPSRCREITGVRMYGHWFSRSQWAFISQKYYAMLAEATGRFQKPYGELRDTYDLIKGRYRTHINGLLGGMRSYFDNAHDVMRDVWEFPRVTGDERFGHATPKPVAMMQRVIKTSSAEGAIVVEPFGGSGPTLIAAELTGRVCYTMELQGNYCDVIVRRWQTVTGKKATLEATGQAFDDVVVERTPVAVSE